MATLLSLRLMSNGGSLVNIIIRCGGPSDIISARIYTSITAPIYKFPVGNESLGYQIYSTYDAF